jgi:hypothetical protein
MAFNDKNQGNQGGMNKNQQGQCCPDRANLNKPATGSSKQGQPQGQNKAGNKLNDVKMEEQGKGKMPNQKGSNQFAGTGSSGNTGNRGSGNSGGSNR